MRQRLQIKKTKIEKVEPIEVNENCNTELNAPITISKTKENKSPDPNDIQYKMIKKLP